MTAISCQYPEMNLLRANVEVSSLDVTEYNNLRQVHPCLISQLNRHGMKSGEPRRIYRDRQCSCAHGAQGLQAARETARDHVNQADQWNEVSAQDWDVRASATSVRGMVKSDDPETSPKPMLPEPWVWRPEDVATFRLPELTLKNECRPPGRPCGSYQISCKNGNSGLEDILSTPTVIISPEDSRWLNIQIGGLALSKVTPLLVWLQRDTGEGLRIQRA